ncbi:carbohydrate-binding family 9-like protein [Tamlana nanhaiensis]|uniref:Carbohydrate-binding family 9-like protein n=1 Tax=Neotamlana nanhaiensis TaxID=1382798 RepID=A0A0D7VZZ9_9FLAO|nr:carbohydrate-binding family 9-like protein [Tamlana nanhaiensis]KJD31182.1 carbohydrate-binding family 9-like protein [Tamlana nanhaiensis]
MNRKLSILLLIAIGASVLGYAQPKTDLMPETYVAYKTNTPISIDGKGDDNAWKNAAYTKLFTDIEGDKRPKYNTKVKMLWDDNYYYILAEMQEPDVWATLKQRDTIIFYNNDFEVFIDPDGDTQNYYELEINALNTVWDLFINEPYREQNVVLNDWTLTGLKSAVTIDGTLNNADDTDKGWTLEIAIPWKAYRASYYHQNIPENDFWRVNFSRVNWQHDLNNGKYSRKKDAQGKFLPEYNWVWSPMGVINMHEPEKWGYVYFSSEAVGSNINFTIPEDDKVKWALFSLYRAQKAYKKEHNIWATNLKDIQDRTIFLNGVTVNPILENHSNGYNITIVSPFSNKMYSITADGQFISLN